MDRSALKAENHFPGWLPVCMPLGHTRLAPLSRDAVGWGLSPNLQAKSCSPTKVLPATQPRYWREPIYASQILFVSYHAAFNGYVKKGSVMYMKQFSQNPSVDDKPDYLDTSLIGTNTWPITHKFGENYFISLCCPNVCFHYIPVPETTT